MPRVAADTNKKNAVEGSTNSHGPTIKARPATTTNSPDPASSTAARSAQPTHAGAGGDPMMSGGLSGNGIQRALFDADSREHQRAKGDQRDYAGQRRVRHQRGADELAGDADVVRVPSVAVGTAGDERDVR